MQVKNDDAGIVFKKFRKIYPKLSKQVVHFYPVNLLTIIVYLEDGSKLSFDYDYERAVRLKDRWKKEE